MRLIQQPGKETNNFKKQKSIAFTQQIFFIGTFLH